MKKINNEKINCNQININNEMVFNENLSELDLITYVIMKKNVGFNRCVLMNINHIYDELNLTDRHYIKQIRNSIIKLSDLDYIGIYNNKYEPIAIQNLKPNDSFIVYFGNDGIYSEQYNNYIEYFDVEYTYINKILKASENVNARFKFIRYALIVRRVCNYDNVDINYLAYSKVKFFISNNNTVTNYNKILQDIGLIYFNNYYVSEKTGKNLITYIAMQNIISEEKFNNSVKDIAISEGYIYQSKEEQSKKHNPKKENKEEFIQEDNETTMLFEELSEEDQELLLELECDNIENDDEIDLHNISDTLEYACKLIDGHNDDRRVKDFYNRTTNSWGNDNPFLK